MPNENGPPPLRAVPFQSDAPRAHASKATRVLFIVSGCALLLCIIPITALAQSMGVTPSPEVAPALGILEVLRSGGSLGVAAICAAWAWRKDTQASEASAARVLDAQAHSAQYMTLVQNMTTALIKFEAVVDALQQSVNQQKNAFDSSERRAG